MAPEDRFFSYKHYLDGNGELIDKEVMFIIARAMIRNKPDSYCMSWDLQTTGISAMVRDLMGLYVRFGVNPSARGAYQRIGFLARRGRCGWISDALWTAVSWPLSLTLPLAARDRQEVSRDRLTRPGGAARIGAWLSGDSSLGASCPQALGDLPPARPIWWRRSRSRRWPRSTWTRRAAREMLPCTCFISAVR